ncbi:hypothetical protein GOODEAATRI_009842, partial [Goodea atripinnis]
VIMKPQSVLQAAIDNEGTKKDFCSQSCLSSFNYKRIMSTKLPVIPAASQPQCSVCSRFCIDVVHKICSDPCFHRFCNINNLLVCENCGSRCNSPLRLKMEDGNKSLCGAECLKLFKQPCSMCCSSKLVSDMSENKTSEDVVELFCSSSCVMASKIQAVCASGVALKCDNCSRKSAPACHLAMSDASIRTFCCLTCAMAFKEFKKLNNMLGVCERCRNKKVINEVKRIDNKDCSFCSDGCLLLFHRELEKKWGKHCPTCSFCLSVSKTVLSAQVEGTKKDFCSEGCRSKYKMLMCHEAKCDTCGRRGKLTESLPLLGNVKHFCDLKCLLRFRNNKDETLTAGSSSPKCAGSVVSVSGALAEGPAPPGTRMRTHGLFLHFTFILFWSFQNLHLAVKASVQTAPKELKNKSMLCVPLVHNKGVSCCVQTKVASAVPVPVPVYVPLPMNLYSQFTPALLVLPVPLPVPVFLPEKKDGSEPTLTEKTQTASLQEEFSFSPERPTEQKGGDERETSQKEEETQTQSLIDWSHHVSAFIDSFFPVFVRSQYLFESSRLENIFTDLNYQRFSSELTRILKCSQPSLSARCFGPSCVQEEFLWGCKQLGAYSPIVLLNTLLFFCCKNFGFNTVEQHRQLSFAHFRQCTRTSGDGTKTTFLRFYPAESRNDAETGSDGVPAKKRRLNENFLDMKENLENPLR